MKTEIDLSQLNFTIKEFREKWTFQYVFVLGLYQQYFNFMPCDIKANIIVEFHIKIRF